MELSVVIVNYNVRYFLEQCLHAVANASRNIESEVFVVDNNSVDGSCAMIREKFPWVKLIENKTNEGFSKANNQALRQAKGKYCLLLNPDTVIEEGTFRKCISFMDEHPESGALGVKMIDGKGNFLPESKRALPTPSVAFFKIFGLSALFPKSKIFGRYHLGYLDRDQIHEVEILSGAFMFLRSEALHKTGLLDEDFFMYGEDIDLSYRMLKENYRNFYFPETTIIHYKGESTKKGSINYVVVFYNAMLIFARKHFSHKNALAFSFLINFAIYIRAALAISRRFVKRIYQPLIDFLLIFAGFWFLTPLWEKFRFGMSDYYPPVFYQLVVPVYILIWLASIYYSGGYEKPVRIWKVLSGQLSGTVIILVLYALLPEDYRFSRALILLGSLWGLLAVLIHRLTLYFIGLSDYELALNRKRRMVIVGFKEEAGRVSNLLQKTQIKPDIVGFVSPDELDDQAYLGNTTQLPEIIKIHKLEEIVFCAKDISSREIIRIMTRVTGIAIDFKIAPPESLSIIGSNSINTAGDLYMINFNSIAKGRNRRTKRLFDLITSLVLLFSWPFLFAFLKSYRENFGNIFRVIFSFRTWVGYCPETDISGLPALKASVFSACAGEQEMDRETREKINMEYARDYKIYNDFSIFWRNIFKTINS
ncbi:MAG: glycosyltransferase [Bacteroidales bacterium]|nr:glycosyltransferase [Bacteroidales bacterium]MCB8999751.1 glycosyltransferase [Bacteroidales bacterium]MCB9013439.1 glycosyltransferase [Bacteroidales bacterium]